MWHKMVETNQYKDLEILYSSIKSWRLQNKIQSFVAQKSHA